MSWNLRRGILVLGVVVSLGVATFFSPAVGQVAKQAPPAAQPLNLTVPLNQPGIVPPNQPDQPVNPSELTLAIDLPRSADVASRIEAARDYINDEDWETATWVLQDLLMERQNYFTRVVHKAPDGKETISWSSIKSETDHLISTLPKNGMEFYKLKYGPVAAEMLKAAKASSDVQQLIDIHRYYLHTDAGAEATDLLGTYLLDRGEYTTAVLCYEKLLNREGSDKLPPITLFKAAYAFSMAKGNKAASENKANEDVCWQKLNTRTRDIRIGSETKSVAELREFIANASRSTTNTVAYDWPMVGGTPNRTSSTPGGPAFLEGPQWKVPLNRTPESREWIRSAESVLQMRGQPLLSAMQPITATVMKDDQKLSLVVFRSYWGIHAVDMKTGKLKWETGSVWSLDKMVRDTKKIGTINNFVSIHLSQTNPRPGILVENSTIGTLSTDSSLVFAVDDLSVPPGQQYQNLDPNGRNLMNYGSPEVNDAVAANRLQAIELATGKLKWEIGGKPDPAKPQLAPELDESYFLGAPMPLGGKLYVLTEKQQDLRLATLDPLTGKLLSVQTLATARDKMMSDVWRRIQSAHLAYGEGILVIPTNVGAILGVDLLSNSLIWAYPYRDKGDLENGAEMFDPRFGGRIPRGFVQGPDGRFYNPNASNTQWKVSPPVIVDGKVVFTAPDANMIHCINLRDGSHIWSQKRGADDCYFAGVYKGNALIVGKGYARALSLNKGEQAWRVDTGLPSGYGIATEDRYYLPLKEAGQSKEPEICAIDLEKGQVVAHTKSRRKAGQEATVPGNLLFFEGDVLSQSATELTSYPQLSVQLAKIDTALRKNPNDPDGLYRRGQLRLDKGDLPGAIEDLRTSLKNKPPEDILPQVREKLHDSFTELFQRDFNKAEGFTKEYEELCKIDLSNVTDEKERTRLTEEQRRRRANFLCLVAKGKEAQGKLVEAFQRYEEYADESAGQDLISVVDEPTVKAAPEVLFGGRIAAMVAKASPENRKPLDDLVNKKWEDLKKTHDVKEVRKFVRVFGSTFAIGKEARLELAIRLMDDSSPLALLEAEQQLSLLRLRGEDPKIAAQAVEALARLNTRKGLLEDASYYYRLLRDEYGKIPVRDGKTGADLFDDMATDKRLLPFLDIPANLGVSGKFIKAVEQRGTFAYNTQAYNFSQEGEKLPFFDRHNVSLRFDYHQLRITDRITNQEKTKNLTRTNFQNMIYGNGQPNLPKYNYLTQGHLVVLPLAHMVFGIDPVRGEVLWERNLFGTKNLNPGQPGFGGAVPMWNQFIVDPKDNSVQLVYGTIDGWVQRLGGAGGLEGSALCLHTRDGLIAIDPVTNETLWTRASINSKCQIFNDAEYVYIVETSSDNSLKPASTRVLRVSDGVSVDVPDFAAQYEKRIRQFGRNLLLSDFNGKGQLTYHLYDVLTGKDLWTVTYSAKAVALKSEDADFGGVIEPDGTVRVLDLRTGKEAMKGQMDPKFLDKLVSVHLLYDGQYFFIACNGQPDINLAQFGGVQTNLMPGTGLRGLLVNGELYCFDAQTGKTKWHNALPNQMIVLDHFADMPMILATARYNRWLNNIPNRQVQQVVTLESIAKSSGKFVFKQENANWQQFHALNIDPRKQSIELVNYQSKITYTTSNEPFPEKK